MTTPSAVGLTAQFNKVARDLGATRQEAERAMRNAIFAGGRRVRGRATKAIHNKMGLAKGRQRSVRRRLRLYNKKYSSGLRRSSVWLGMVGIGAEVFYSLAESRRALRDQSTSRPGNVLYQGNTIPRSFWVNVSKNKSRPVPMVRYGSARRDIRHAQVPFIKHARRPFLAASDGIHFEVVREFERQLRLLVAARTGSP